MAKKAGTKKKAPVKRKTDSQIFKIKNMKSKGVKRKIYV